MTRNLETQNQASADELEYVICFLSTLDSSSLK